MQYRRRSPATKMHAHESRRIDLFHGDDREHVENADAGDGIELAVEYPLRKAVPCGRHWDLLGPAVAVGVVRFIGAEDAAQFIEPTFAPDYVNLAVDYGGPKPTPRSRHWRAREPRICRNVVNLVH